MKLLKTALVILGFAATSMAHAADTTKENKTIRLATTTSTYHSGLLDYLLPEFKKDTGYSVDVLAAEKKIQQKSKVIKTLLMR